MREGLHEPVSVLAGYSHKDKLFRPLVLTWEGRNYRMGKLDFYHKTKSGLKVLHHFSLADRDEQVYVKLVFDSSSLNWTLEEYQMAGDSHVVY